MTLALGTRLASSGSGGNVTPVDPPILRRDLLQEDGFDCMLLLESGDRCLLENNNYLLIEFEGGYFILQEDGTSKIVLSFGTYDKMATEQGTDLILTEASDKLILTVY